MAGDAVDRPPPWFGALRPVSPTAPQSAEDRHQQRHRKCRDGECDEESLGVPTKPQQGATEERTGDGPDTARAQRPARAGRPNGWRINLARQRVETSLAASDADAGAADDVRDMISDALSRTGASRARPAIAGAALSLQRRPSDASRVAGAYVAFSNWPGIQVWRRHSATSRAARMRSGASST
jgi:hypothetical protein